MHVLIVDDRPPNLRLLRYILESEEHSVSEAADGVEALALLETQSVDAIISDILMPRMDGYRLCQQVRSSERWKDTPFIFYTATYTSPGDEKLCIDIGGDKYLKKPASAEAILAALEEVSHRKVGRSHPVKSMDETEVMKEYNSRLVFKLEEKIAELAIQSTAMEYAANAIVITDVKGTILTVNPAFSKLSGYSSQEVIGQNPRILKSGTHDQAFYRELWQTILGGNTWRGEFINRRKDGTLYHGEQTITPVCAKPGNITHFIGIMNDVTERKQAEAELRRTSDLLRAVADGSSDAVFVKDIEGRYLLANEAAARFVGRSVDEMVGHDDTKLFDAESARQVMANDQSVRESGTSQTNEEHLTAAGVSRTYLATKAPYRDSQGTVIGTIGISHDITDRKRNEALIREQAAMLDRANEAIIVRDIHTRRITFWNRGAERLYGWTAAEVAGRDIGELIFVDRNAPDAVTAQLLATGESHAEHQHTTKDGRQLIVSGHATLMLDPEGRPKSSLVINIDVTEQKNLEARFLRAQRMESIGTLASGVAHDLNNILAPIMMAVQVLRLDLPAAEREEVISTIELSAERGAQIVRQVLTFGRGLEGKKSLLQAEAVVREVLKIIGETFPKNIIIEHNIAPKLWPLMADATQLHQVLLNLCVNARDAMPAGGRLIISARNGDLDAHYASMLPDASPGPYVILEVTDSGTGIPPEIIDQVFDPFFTTKEAGKGTGLGLSTVHGIVKGHGGCLTLKSQPHEGTTVQIFLPASPNQAVAPSAPPASLAVGSGEVILVVDDEGSVRSTARLVLESAGYQVLLASEGTEALTLFAANSAKVAAVVTDLSMPLIDGFALIRALRSMSAKLPILASTGLGEKSRVEQLHQMGIETILHKPYSADTLLRAIHDVLNQGV